MVCRLIPGLTPDVNDSTHLAHQGRRKNGATDFIFVPWKRLLLSKAIKHRTRFAYRRRAHQPRQIKSWTPTKCTKCVGFGENKKKENLRYSFMTTHLIIEAACMTLSDATRIYRISRRNCRIRKRIFIRGKIVRLFSLASNFIDLLRIKFLIKLIFEINCRQEFE